MLPLVIFEKKALFSWNSVILQYFREKLSQKCPFLTLFRMGGGGKPPTPNFFSPVTSTNVGFGPQNFLAFSFNPFATLVQNFKFVPGASPKLLNLNQDQLSKKAIFWSNKSLWNWGYDNFSHRNATVIKLWPHDHNYI